MHELVDVVFLYATFMDNNNANDAKRFSSFLTVASNEIFGIIFATLESAGCLLFMAMISSRYKRLRVLVGTTVQNGNVLDDFEILQDTHASYTLFDVPITFRTVLTVVNVAILQVVLLALAAV